MFTVYPRNAAFGPIKVDADSWEHASWDNESGCTIEQGFEFFIDHKSVAYFSASEVLGIVG